MSDLNKSDFSFQIITNIAYDIVWSGIEVVDTLIARFIQQVTIVAASSANVKADVEITSTNTITAVEELLSVAEASIDMVSTMTVSFISQESLVFTNAIASAISFVDRVVIDVASTISQTNAITADAIVATFYLLVDYDPDALSTMDTETLGDIFYNIP